MCSLRLSARAFVSPGRSKPADGRRQVNDVPATSVANRPSPLAGIRPENLAPIQGSEPLGGLLEAFAAGELIKQRTWSAEDFNGYHFRDRNGLEVDLAIEYAAGCIFLLAVKASQSYRPEHTKAIRTLGARLGSRFFGGAVLGLTEQGYLLGEKIYGLPLSVLWESAAQ
ncbi:MAG: DUF4143 domain-containing protein [Propionibacteriaceae bacterium]|nr:DUF4143 domain-containing protein [Propionibacteriaceae bacterium]